MTFGLSCNYHWVVKESPGQGWAVGDHKHGREAHKPVLGPITAP